MPQTATNPRRGDKPFGGPVGSNTALRSCMGRLSARSPVAPALPPDARLKAAKEDVKSIRERLLGLVSVAQLSGFETRELLEVPAIRQTLRAARQGLEEVQAARDVSAARA
jgi:hypothetical protein